MEYILTSLDMFASISENLINFTFNVSRFAALMILMAANEQKLPSAVDGIK
jgi:hypothetical protein